MNEPPKFKYVFFGTPQFAAIILERIIEAGMPPVAVVCNPDRPVGRKHIITKPPTKLIAEKHQIAVIQPEKLDEAFVDAVKNIRPDFFIVAAYAKIIPKRIIDIPRLGSIGIHPSMLPKFRGPSPIQSAILAGETVTGVTMYLMDEQTDHGPILMQQFLPTPGNPAFAQPREELEDGLARLGANLALLTVIDLMAEKIRPQPQDEHKATFTKKFTTEDGFVAEQDLDAARSGDTHLAENIFRKINALNPDPGVWTLHDNKRIKLLKAKLEDNRIVLTQTQKEGEKPKPADF